MAEFIAENLPFVAHVALMGLEMTGFTKANSAALWIDPFDYQEQLATAVERLELAGIHTSLYNHPLCLLPEGLWPFARHSSCTGITSICRSARVVSGKDSAAAFLRQQHSNTALTSTPLPTILNTVFPYRTPTGLHI